ncbi:Os04g0415600 [Oryza sativa Japonica Group]|nr:Os04g0415600 [Oryza sativa Japonica Group]|eukprot:NP_001173929.1 Os04g0415600 [Oryza sativa Japonica Group]
MRGMGDDGMGPMAMAPPRSGHATAAAPPPPQHKMAMMMHMTFFWSDRAVVLIRGWPGERGAGMYALCLLFVLALAALTEGLSVLSRRLARRGGGAASSDGGRPAPAPASSAALLTAVHAARMGMAYLVMLAVMSFNVGVLLAAVAGHALGFLLARSRVRPAARDGGGGVASIHNCPEVPWKKERKLSKNEDLAHKFFKSTKEGHFASSCPCKIDDEATLPRKTSRINKRKCYGCNEKGHEIGFCPHKKDDHCNQSSKRQTGNKQVKKQDKSKTQLSYNCRVKRHIGKNCPIAIYNCPEVPRKNPGSSGQLSLLVRKSCQEVPDLLPRSSGP